MKISVIVPAFNAERYIDKCVYYLINQTYKDLEFIFVNDGSKDRTQEVIEKYIALDNRIKIINKENGGLSSARNAGLKVVSGDYVFFLDSDDWLDYDYFENCVKQLYLHPVDILFTPYIREYKNVTMKNKLFEKDKIIFSGSEDVKDKLLLRLFGPSEDSIKSPTTLNNLNTAWGKLYKWELVENLRFEDRNKVGTAEDLWFNIHSFYNASSAYYYGKKFVHYNKANTCSLVSTYHPEMFEITQNLYRMMHSFIEEMKLGKKYVSALENRVVLESFSQVLSLEYSDLTYSKKRAECKRIISNSQFEKCIRKFDYKNVPIKWSIFFKLESAGMVDAMLGMTSIAIELREKVKR